MSEGYAALFLSAFLAASILPFSSEALLGGMMVSDRFDQVWLLVVASTGNTLGAVVNWALGRFFYPLPRSSVVSGEGDRT